MVVVVGRGDVADVGGMVVVNELTKEGSAHHDDIPETTNDDIVVVRRLVATSPTATWHLRIPPDSGRNQWRTIKTSGSSIVTVEHSLSVSIIV